MECSYEDIDHECSALDDADEKWTEPLNQGAENAHQNPHNITTLKLGHSRTIIHLDINCFYAQVEMLRNPELRNKPLGIQQKNIVVTTNYVARNLGIPKCTSVTEARKTCPDLVLVNGEDLSNYRQMSYRISEFLQKYTPYVERLGFDENFVDVSELVASRIQHGKYKEEFTGHVYGSGQAGGMDKPPCSCGCELRLQVGSQIAADVRSALETELGITSCAGISYNKLLAKLVAGTHKPNQQTTVQSHMTQELMFLLFSVVRIPGIGYKTGQRLSVLGVSSVLDLQTCDQKMLENEFGQHQVQTMIKLSYGVDDSPVTPYTQPQTLSEEDAFQCCKDLTDAEERIKDLLVGLLKRVVEDGRVPQTVRLTVRRVPNKYHRESKQCPVPANTFLKRMQTCAVEDVAERLMPVLMNLFYKLVDTSKPFHLTLFGISFTNLAKPVNEQGKISTYFTKSDVSSQHIESNLDQNEKVINKQLSNACLSVAKVSPEKPAVNAKLEGKIKTIKHFFPLANNGILDTALQGLSPTKEKTFCDQASMPQNDVSLSVSDIRPQSTDRDSPTKYEHFYKNVWSQHESERYAGDFVECEKVLQTHVTEYCHTGQTKDIVTEGNHTFSELKSLGFMVDKCLQNLLPENIDVHTIEELPLDIQKEVLSQYGIYVENLPEGRFVHMPDRIQTRSSCPQKSVSSRVRKSQRTLRREETHKRKPDFPLVYGEDAGGISEIKVVKLAEESEAADDHLSVSFKAKISAHSKPAVHFISESPSHIKNIQEEKCSLDVTSSTNCFIIQSDSSQFGELEHEDAKLDEGLLISTPSNTSPESVVLCLSDDQCTNKVAVNSVLDTDSVTQSQSHFCFQNGCGSSKKPSAVISAANLVPGHICHSSNTSSPRVSQRKAFHHKLPDNIDSEVFSSLPRKIQGEIMAHVIMGTTYSAGDHHAGNKSTMNQKSSTHVEDVRQKSQNTLLTYFRHTMAENKKKD